MAKGVYSTIENARSRAIVWVRDVAMTWDSDECLTWPFNRNPTGYARTWYEGKMIYAHQLVCMLIHGPRPSPKHDAAHSCGNGHQGCVNRRHLSWQTKSANQKDGWKKRGRQRYKLTPGQVAQIKAIKGLEPARYTAARYDVNERTIRKIQSGEGWKLGTYAFRGKPIRCATSRTEGT